MKLLRRKSEPTTAEKVLAIFGKVVKALAAVRAARTAYGTYKFARRLPLLVGGAAVVGGIVFAARKLRGGGDSGQVETWSPPAPASSPSPSSSSSSTPAGTGPGPGPELTPNPAETAGTGSPSPDLEPATPPSVSAEGGEDVAEAPGESSEASTDKA